MKIIVFVAKTGDWLVSFVAAILATVMLLYGGYALWDTAMLYQGAVDSGNLMKYKTSVSVEEDGESLEELLEMNPDVNGIFATNGDTTMQALTACEGKDMKDVVIMGYDADQEEIDAMKDGRIAGMIVQNPYGMGYATVVAEARCVLNMGNEANVNTGYTWVTPDNIEDRTVQDILYAEK